jgi:hypothetical protein
MENETLNVYGAYSAKEPSLLYIGTFTEVDVKSTINSFIKIGDKEKIKSSNKNPFNSEFHF